MAGYEPVKPSLEAHMAVQELEKPDFEALMAVTELLMAAHELQKPHS